MDQEDLWVAHTGCADGHFCHFVPWFYCISKLAGLWGELRLIAITLYQSCPENKAVFFLQSTYWCLFPSVSRKTMHSCPCKHWSSRFLDGKQGICPPDKVPGALKCVRRWWSSFMPAKNISFSLVRAENKSLDNVLLSMTTLCSLLLSVTMRCSSEASL